MRWINKIFTITGLIILFIGISGSAQTDNLRTANEWTLFSVIATGAGTISKTYNFSTPNLTGTTDQAFSFFYAENSFSATLAPTGLAAATWNMEYRLDGTTISGCGVTAAVGVGESDDNIDISHFCPLGFLQNNHTITTATINADNIQNRVHSTKIVAVRISNRTEGAGALPTNITVTPNWIEEAAFTLGPILAYLIITIWAFRTENPLAYILSVMAGLTAVLTLPGQLEEVRYLVVAAMVVTLYYVYARYKEFQEEKEVLE